MVREIALTDLKLKYQGSVLGYLWSLLKPLMLFGIMFLVFTKVFKLGNSIPNYPVYLLLGIVIWTFFSEVTGLCMGAIVGKGNLIRKVYFPRILLVIANSITSLITFVLNLAIVFVFMFGSGIQLQPRAFFFILIIIELYIFIFGVALILSALYVKFRDIAHIWEVLLQALFYATPILYPMSFVPAPYNTIVSLSPVAQIIQDSRYFLLSAETTRVGDVLHFPLVLVPYLLPFIILAVGYFIFNKMSAKFAEEV
jgi:ABC-2 type transport system permease protein